MQDEDFNSLGDSKQSLLEILSLAQDSGGSLNDAIDSLVSPGGAWDDDCGQQIASQYLTPMRQNSEDARRAIESQGKLLENAGEQIKSAISQMEESKIRMSAAFAEMDKAATQNQATAGLCEHSRSVSEDARRHAQRCETLIEDAAKAGSAA